MKTPDFTKASHEFSGNFIEWCEDVVHLGFGDLLVEQAMQIALAGAKKDGKPCTVTRESLRFWGYEIYLKQGWDEKKLLRMGFKPIVGDWRDSYPGRKVKAAR
jgi:N-acetyl-anhydromuramyl-L-alanine amidase AmpD